MAITLGTNTPAYIARMTLNSTTNSYSTTLERLSTGLKINRAGDDAAGLVISENMEAQIRSSKQAQANIQTATSFLDIAEDGMVSISDHLQRINDLLTNMANDTNDDDSRTAAIDEIIERLDEINRLAESITFNGKTMLDGSADSIIVQLGSDSTDLSTLDISPALTDCHTAALDVELPSNLDPDDSSFDPSNANCRAYMENIQTAIANLSTCQGLIGAYENRLDSSYDALTTRIESLEAAKGVYVDTDIAEETTNMTNQQILAQINVSVLAQANSIQSLALSLFGS